MKFSTVSIFLTTIILRAKVFLAVAVLCLSLSCTKETIIQGTPGADGKDGIDGANITATVIDLEIGSEECPNGGSIVTLFADGIQFDEIVTCNGEDGENGQDGTNGESGQDGTNGTDGQDGTNGTDGQDGADGQNGQDGVNCWDLNGNGAADPEEDTNGDGEYNGLDCQGQSTDNIVDMNGDWITDEVIQGSAIQMTTFNSLFVPNASNGENTYFVDILWDNRLAEDVSFTPTNTNSYRMGPTVAVIIGTDRVLEGLEFENFGTENERLYVLIRNVKITGSEPTIVYFEGYLTRN